MPPVEGSSVTGSAYIEPRFRVGCAGMFALGQDYGVHGEDEAIVACEAGPAGCEAYDTVAKRWIGPTCWGDIADAKARLAQWNDSGRER
jgi:hypothetical protein